MMSQSNCVRQQEPLADHTSFRIGGPAEFFAEPSTLAELITLLRNSWRSGLPVSVLGGGTNTLAPDRGIRGTVIHLGRGFRTVEELSNPDEAQATLRCGSALLTQRLVYLATQRGWGDLELLAGLPGWIGGAISMNAQDIGRFVKQVSLVSLDGTLQTLDREELSFSYRYAALRPGIITDVVLQFPKVPAAEAYNRIRSALQYRNSTQETRLPSAGCAFKNPAGNSAGKLIDQAGLKGTRIGDAQISQRHANFIVNLGFATCDDVLSLMEYVQRRVDRVFGVSLEPEVRMIGEQWKR